MSDKLVKTDSAIESASREFAARLTKMLGALEASSVPAVVRLRPTGPKLKLSVGEHEGTLYEVSVGKTPRGRDIITFAMEIDASTSMPVLGPTSHVIILDGGYASISAARSTLESVGLLDEFLAAVDSGKTTIECNKRIAVMCVDKLLRSGNKFMYVSMKLIDA